MIEAWTAAAHGDAVEVTESSVLHAFDRVKIVDPQTGEEGAVELDVLRTGARTASAGTGSARSRACSLLDHDLVRTAAWLFGGLYIGLELPISAQWQETWDWNGLALGRRSPGLVGRSRRSTSSATTRLGLTVVTWGRLKEMTWSFWDRYCDEAYCILSHDFLDGDQAPNGFDLEALKADLALVTA